MDIPSQHPLLIIPLTGTCNRECTIPVGWPICVCACEWEYKKGKVSHLLWDGYTEHQPSSIDLSPNLKALVTMRNWGCTPLIRRWPGKWPNFTYRDTCTIKVSLVEGQLSIHCGSVWLYSSIASGTLSAHQPGSAHLGAAVTPEADKELSFHFATPVLSFTYAAECPKCDFGGRNLYWERELFSICFHSS